MPRRQLFVALAPVYLSVFLFVAGSSALSILIPVYLSRRGGLGAAQIGLVIGVFGLSSLAARLPAGMAYSAARGNTFLTLCPSSRRAHGSLTTRTELNFSPAVFFRTITERRR